MVLGEISSVEVESMLALIMVFCGVYGTEGLQQPISSFLSALDGTFVGEIRVAVFIGMIFTIL